jgi:hypothetical protein
MRLNKIRQTAKILKCILAVFLLLTLVEWFFNKKPEYF